MDKVIIEPRMPKRQKHSLERKQSRYGYLFTLPIILCLRSCIFRSLFNL